MPAGPALFFRETELQVTFSTPAGSAVRPQARPAHPLVVRITHWVGAYAMICMILSGWQIYNASPILPFRFPPWATLGGWLGGALAWHFAAMWLLLADGAVYLGYSILSGHITRDMWPVRPAAVARDLWAALTLRLHHRTGEYNAVQKLLYLGVLTCAVLIVCTGFAIWKPVQLAPLTGLLGGYDVARRIHFALMSVIVAFLVLHVALVAIVPSTLLSMITGGRRALDAGQEP
jgi:thiosulfate reductase cytochrome b subunit